MENLGHDGVPLQALIADVTEDDLRFMTQAIMAIMQKTDDPDIIARCENILGTYATLEERSKKLLQVRRLMRRRALGHISLN